MTDPTTSSVIPSLFATIQARKENPPPGSYTAELFAKGLPAICQKVGEEAVEVIVAAQGESDDRVIYELADLVYHSLVLLAHKGLTWEQVEAGLARRFK